MVIKKKQNCLKETEIETLGMDTNDDLLKIFNGQIITPDDIIKRGTIIIRNGIIESLSAGNTELQGAIEIDANGKYIAPGLVDNQVNGFAGVSFSLGGDGLTEEGVEKATQELWKAGVTSYLPTLTTNSRGVMKENLAILAKAADYKELMGSIPGFHLEGPYINPEDGYRGAHPSQFVRLPDWDEFMELYEASGQRILQITLAPEMEGALNFIDKCREKGIVVALGHHNAPAHIVTAAIDRGAKIATHFGNGAANMVNRHFNPFWSQLADDRLHISIICDSFHLLPEEIKVFYKIKGVEKTILTSDVTCFATLQPGLFQAIELTKEGLLHYPEQKCLYGSASPLTKGIGHIIKVTGCPLAGAIRMASANASRLLGLTNIGELAPGKRADLVFFGMEDGEMVIYKTFVKGKEVFSKQ
jgi:N-acetylglucosamine-6-phosphate deacetylase